MGLRGKWLKVSTCTYCWGWFQSVAFCFRYRSQRRGEPRSAPHPQSAHRVLLFCQGRCRLQIHPSSPRPHSLPQTHSLHPRRTSVHMNNSQLTNNICFTPWWYLVNVSAELTYRVVDPAVPTATVILVLALEHQMTLSIEFLSRPV